ncbi:Protein disulfide isomerase-like 1-4 [Triticum urartu]|uniref:protein disulfide-isomerase n=1 Tax=Triticum urartu TaxID=4572 RepID=M7ZH58_TRIUA|nr:Protein disulfide isomerase-like 1-4 [Triticum urartu]
MPTPRSFLLLLLLATPFLLLPLAASAAVPTSNPDIDLEYLIKNAGLDDSTPSTPTDDPEDGAPDFPGLDADYDEDEDLFGDDDGPEEDSSHPSAADEAHVLLLTAANFTAVLAARPHAMIEGAHSDELAAASRLEDTISFYQTTSPDVAKLFHIDPEAKRPSIVLLKKEEEKLTVFDGEFRASAIAEFVSANKIPLITTLTQETAPAIFDNPIKKQILLFAVAKESSKFLPIIKETAKSFKGKLLFVFVERDNEEVGEPVANYFGITGHETTVLAYTGNEDAKKFFFSGEISLDTIKEFAQDFLEDKLTPSYKSDPVPESNDEDVKVVVGKSLDQIVLDESKDVLLEVYAPWCGHCQSLEPIYNKLAKYLRGIDSLVIAKMDGTNNEHPRAKPDGFPTILFYPAGKKSFEPITFEGDRTVVEMYKFLKKHAAIPFKLKRPDSSAAQADGSSSTAEGEKSSGWKPKDEL